MNPTVDAISAARPEPTPAAAHAIPPPLPRPARPGEPANADVEQPVSGGFLASIGGWPALIAASALGIALAVGMWLLAVKLGGSRADEPPKVLAGRNVGKRSLAAQTPKQAPAKAAAPPMSRAADGVAPPQTSAREAASPAAPDASNNAQSTEATADSQSEQRAEESAADDVPTPAGATGARAGPDSPDDSADTMTPTPTSGSAGSGESAGSASRRALIVERLDVALAQIEFNEQPLASLAEFIAQLTGVPVVLDQKALARRDKNGQTRVSVKLSDTTAVDALTAALTPHGLVYEIRGTQVVITVPRASVPAKGR